MSDHARVVETFRSIIEGLKQKKMNPAEAKEMNRAALGLIADAKVQHAAKVARTDLDYFKDEP